MPFMFELKAAPSDVARVLAFLDENHISFSVTDGTAPTETAVQHAIPEDVAQLIQQFTSSVRNLANMPAGHLSGGLNAGLIDNLGQVATQLSSSAELLNQATSTTKLHSLDESARLLAGAMREDKIEAVHQAAGNMLRASQSRPGGW